MDKIQRKLMDYASNKNINQILAIGFFIRLLALLYSEIHDSLIDHIKYTDIDYQVFTNGSRLVRNGMSPYTDTEYRYSPVFAIFFLPNVLIANCFGKFILITADIVCALFIFIINLYIGNNRIHSKYYVMIWLLNPLTIAISTRGSSEPLTSLLILAIIYLINSSNLVVAGLLYGLVIHLRMYPVIYCFSFYLFLSKYKPVFKENYFKYLRYLKLETKHIKFFVSTALSFSLITHISYLAYGDDYINQSFIYHLKRRDLQHNFSIYFFLYHILPKHRNLLSSIAFLPQFISILVISFIFRPNGNNSSNRLKLLTFSMFCETFLFVTLNKVCTSQYFCWYFILLPLIISSIKLSSRKLINLMKYWFIVQGIWLLSAYLYEYQKLEIAFLATGFASTIFLICNLYIILFICYNYSETK